MTEFHKHDAEALKLWGTVELGLGGYVIGRSACIIADGSAWSILEPTGRKS